jgi:hypothetical protein
MKPKKFAFANTLRDPEEEKYNTRTFSVCLREMDNNDEIICTHTICDLKILWLTTSLSSEQYNFIEGKLKEYTHELRDYLNDSLKVEVKKLYL